MAIFSYKGLQSLKSPLNKFHTAAEVNSACVIPVRGASPSSSRREKITVSANPGPALKVPGLLHAAYAQEQVRG